METAKGNSRSVMIIGAGIAGLSAGIYAQLNGYRSRIYEMHSLPGGLRASPMISNWRSTAERSIASLS